MFLDTVFRLARTYWVSVVLLVAVVAVGIYQHNDAVRRDRNLRSALITVCKSTSERVTLLAGQQATLSLAAGGKRVNQAIADGITDLIPLPSYVVRGDPRIIQSKLLKKPGLPARFVLTESARKIQDDGCRNFYGA